MAKNLIQKLIDSGMEFTEVSRSQAEAVVKHLVRAGELRRSEAGRTAQLLVDRGRSTSASISDTIQSEVAKQVDWLAARVEDLEGQIEALVSSIASTGAAVLPGAQPAAKQPAAANTATKKTVAQKSAAQKSAAQKSAAQKTAAKKAGAKKAGAKKQAAGKRTAAKQA